MKTIFIGWYSPPEGWTKPKCDGAHKETVDLVGCGVLLWDSNGRRVQGDTQKIDVCGTLYVEMKVVCRNKFGLETRSYLPRCRK
jgi:hypothetical protein